MYEKLEELFYKLRIPTAKLIMLDVITGAGYITIGDDTVFLRWGSYKEGIRYLQIYIDVGSIPGPRL